jgi:hypothetical protein
MWNGFIAVSLALFAAMFASLAYAGEKRVEVEGQTRSR